MQQQIWGNFIPVSSTVHLRMQMQGRPKKRGHCSTAYNFRNIDQIGTKFGRNQRYIILNITP